MNAEPEFRSDAETECEKLRGAIAQLHAENQWLRRCLGDLLFEEIDVDDDEMLALSGSQPSFEALIGELEAVQG